MDVRWGEQKEVDRKRRKTIDDIMVAGGRELIDTLWNVNNILRLLNNSQLSRINRYIMECKCKIPCSSAFCNFELIDTLWNVN